MKALPPWDAVEREMRGIFERRYFANNGPLVQRLDRELAALHAAPHACVMASEHLALAVVARAIDSNAKALIAAYHGRDVGAALAWAGLEVASVDVDPATGLIDAQAAKPHLAPGTVIFAARGIAEPEGFAASIRAFEAAGCHAILDVRGEAGAALPDVGDAAIVALDTESIVTAISGGVALTRSEELDKKLRTMRNFHVGETFTDVPLRMNAKMSEAQAAIALASLEELEQAKSRAVYRWQQYAERLADASFAIIPLRRSGPAANVLLLLDEPDRADRAAALLGERGMRCDRPYLRYDVDAFPGARLLGTRLLRLPNDDTIEADAIETIVRLIERA